MGVLHYMDYRLDFDDRTLLHLQIVIAQKIRRQEAFFFSWVVPSREGGGRRSIWIDNAIPLRFSFQATSANSINPAWIEALAMTSNQGSGLHLLAEPALPVTRTASPMPRLATPAH